MTLSLRPLGRSDLRVSPLCFGGNVLGWTADEATSFRLLDAWVDAGFNFIDTADVYSRWAPGHQGGESETVIGRWLKATGKRDRVIIATKVGMEMAADRKGLAPDYIRRAVEDSLRRLQIDCIDLYQSHTDDAATPIEETLGAYADLIAAGKVRHIGASNFSAARLAAALKISSERGLPRYQSLQPHYNLIERTRYEAELEPLCRAEEVGVISYFALASGFLTGKYRSEADLGKSVRGARAKQYLNDRGMAILAALDQVAAETAATPTAVALAWLIAHPGISAPIVSATSLPQLQDVMAGARLTLTVPQIELLNAASV